MHDADSSTTTMMVNAAAAAAAADVDAVEQQPRLLLPWRRLTDENSMSIDDAVADDKNSFFYIHENVNYKLCRKICHMQSRSNIIKISNQTALL